MPLKTPNESHGPARNRLARQFQDLSSKFVFSAKSPTYLGDFLWNHAPFFGAKAEGGAHSKRHSACQKLACTAIPCSKIKTNRKCLHIQGLTVCLFKQHIFLSIFQLSNKNTDRRVSLPAPIHLPRLKNHHRHRL